VAGFLRSRSTWWGLIPTGLEAYGLVTPSSPFEPRLVQSEPNVQIVASGLKADVWMGHYEAALGQIIPAERAGQRTQLLWESFDGEGE